MLASKYFRYSLISKDLFPENPWKPWNFHTIGRNWWQDKANHKAFLEDYATAHNFKSHEDWYTVTTRDVSNLFIVCLTS